MEFEEWWFYLSQVEGATPAIFPSCYPPIHSVFPVGLRRSDLETLQSDGSVPRIVTRARIASECKTIQVLNVCHYHWCWYTSRRTIFWTVGTDDFSCFKSSSKIKYSWYRAIQLSVFENCKIQKLCVRLAIGCDTTRNAMNTPPWSVGSSLLCYATRRLWCLFTLGRQNYSLTLTTLCTYLQFLKDSYWRSCDRYRRHNSEIQ